MLIVGDCVGAVADNGVHTDFAWSDFLTNKLYLTRGDCCGAVNPAYQALRLNETAYRNGIGMRVLYAKILVPPHDCRVCSERRKTLALAIDVNAVRMSLHDLQAAEQSQVIKQAAQLTESAANLGNQSTVDYIPAGDKTVSSRGLADPLPERPVTAWPNQTLVDARRAAA